MTDVQSPGQKRDLGSTSTRDVGLRMLQKQPRSPTPHVYRSNIKVCSYIPQYNSLFEHYAREVNVARSDDIKIFQS